MTASLVSRDEERHKKPRPHDPYWCGAPFCARDANMVCLLVFSFETAQANIPMGKTRGWACCRCKSIVYNVYHRCSVANFQEDQRLGTGSPSPFPSKVL